jgi:hypothetical protein
VRRLLALLGLALTALVLLAAPASAAPFDCKDAPTPDTPGRGLAGYFTSDPEVPEPGDPFAEKPTTSIYEQYGYAGLRFTTYDLGCGPDAARNPEATVGTAISNWLLEIPKAGVALTNALTDVAFEPTFLGAFDGLLEHVTSTLRETVFESFLGLALAALGFGLIWKARRGNLASTAGAVGWAVFVMVLATVLFRYPVAAGHVADDTVTTALGAVNAGLNGVAGQDSDDPADAAAGSLHDAVLYQQWLTGTFGKSNGATAEQYGPVIFDSQALTWAEAALPAEERAAVIEAKQERWEQAAAEIQESDPDAYAYFTGKRSESRMGAVLVSLFAMLCAAPFVLVSALLIIGAFLIVRLAVMFAPLLLVMGILMPGVVRGVGNTVGAAIVNCVAFGVGAAFTVLSIGILLDPASGLPTWLALMLVALFSVVMFTVLRPFRRLTRMVRNPDPFGDAASALGDKARGAVDSAKRAAMGAVTSGVGAYVGTKQAVENAAEEEAERQQQESPTTVRAESYSAPAPAPRQVAQPAIAPVGAPAPALAAAPVVAGLHEDEAPVHEGGPIVVPSTGAIEPPPPAALPPVDVYVPEDEEAPVLPANTSLAPPVEPEIVDGDEVFVLYRPEVGAEVTDA